MEIIAVLFFLISPYFSLLVSILGYAFQPTREKLWLFLLVTFVFVSAFCINTNGGNDLDRYYAILDICKHLSFLEVIDQLDDGLLLENFIFWFFSHLGVYELMPAISAATVFGVGCYIAGDSAKRTNTLNILWLLILYLVLTIPIFNLASNVRNVLAFSLITLGVYRDLVQKNRGIVTSLLYVAPCFLHVTGIVVASIRFVIPIIRRFPLIFMIFIGTLSELINVAYSQLLYLSSLEGVLGNVIRKLIAKAYRYMYGMDDFSKLMVNSRFDQLNRPITFLMAIIIAYFSISLLRKKNNEYRDFAVYCFMLSVIVLSCSVFSVPAFWRFAVAMEISFSLVFCVIIGEMKKLNMVEGFLFGCLGITGLVKFAITIPYLSSRMDLMQYLLDTSLTNIYFIFIKTFFSVILI